MYIHTCMYLCSLYMILDIYIYNYMGDAWAPTRPSEDLLPSSWFIQRGNQCLWTAFVRVVPRSNFTCHDRNLDLSEIGDPWKSLILIIFIFPTETTIFGISIIFQQILVFVWCSQSLNKPCKPSFLLTSCLCVCVWFKISKCLPLSNSMDGWVVNSDQHLLVHFGTSFLLVLKGSFFLKNIFRFTAVQVLISWVGRLQDKGKEIIMKAGNDGFMVPDGPRWSQEAWIQVVFVRRIYVYLTDHLWLSMMVSI
jgi:hypothetical protein